MGTFKQWFYEVQRVYPTRFDPEDAALLATRPPEPPPGEEADPSRRGGLWQMAYDQTLKRVRSSYGGDLRDATKEVWRYLIQHARELFEKRPELKCRRCDGQGHREERESWVRFTTGDKTCFRCSGSGIEPEHHPIYRRRFTVDKIKRELEQGNIKGVQRWANRVEAASMEEQPYKPVLMDIVELVKAERFDDIMDLPH